VGQEFFLFSWRLLLCDLVMAAYVLAVTFFLLLVRFEYHNSLVIHLCCRKGDDNHPLLSSVPVRSLEATSNIVAHVLLRFMSQGVLKHKRAGRRG
jgi:hypothetical protein